MITSTFIDQLAAGQAADAKETLSNLLSARAFEALDTRKQELASTLFGGQVEEVEQITEVVTVKKEYDDDEQSEHGVYKGKKKIGYVVHDKKENTHTAYHGPQGRDDFGHIDDFSHHDKAVSQIKQSAGIREEVEELEELSKATLRGYLKGSKSEAESQLRGDVSDKAASLGRTQQDKDDGRYEGNKLARRKLGAPGSIPPKVMAK